MSANNDEHHSAGTVPSPEYRRAGCGIRFEEGELKAGIDFSGARELLQNPSDAEATQKRLELIDSKTL